MINRIKSLIRKITSAESAERRVLRWVLQYILPSRGVLLILFMLIVANGLIGLIPPCLVKRLVDGITAAGALRARQPGLLIAALGAVYLLTTLLSMLEGRLATPLGARVAHAMRLDVYGAIQRLQLGRLHQSPPGELVSRLIDDVQTLHVFMMDVVVAFAPQLVILGGVFIALCLLHWALALVVLAPFPFVLLVTAACHGGIKGRFARASRRMGRLFAIATDRLTGLRDVKLMGREAAEVELLREASWSFGSALIDAVRASVIFGPAIRLIYCLGLLPALYLGIRGVSGEGGWPWQGMTLGTLVAFMSYLGLTYAPLHNIGRIYGRLTQAWVSARRIFEILDAGQEPYDAPGARGVGRLRGELRFEDVHFAYLPEKPILRGIDFQLRPGEFLGVAGRSGAGKTTLASLICRFWEPQRGAIRLDGMDLREIRLESLRAAIAVIPQDPYLFDATVAENIAIGKPGATREEILRATRQANMLDIVIRWPDGFDTRVGPRGARLSEGERHLIAIARAFLRDPGLLILDEATAAMDHFTERQVGEGLERLMAGRTSIVIAHRLPTLRRADQIMVLEGGRVAEWGTPAQLMERRGLYYEMAAGEPAGKTGEGEHARAAIQTQRISV